MTKTKSDFLVQIDSREPGSIQSLFKNKVVRELPVGDIALMDVGIVIERKEYADFVSSVFSKHLEKQLAELSMLPEGMTPLLVIVGSLKRYNFSLFHSRKNGAAYASGSRQPNWTAKHHIGFLASKLKMFPRVHILQVSNNTQLKLLVMKLHEKFVENKAFSIDSTELMRAPKLEANDRESIRARMLLGIPGIGPETARRLIKQVGGLRPLMAMSKEELEALEGIGPATAQSIIDAFL